MSKQEWSSIDSLMAGKAPGSLELVTRSELRCIPYYKNKLGAWIGQDQDGTDSKYSPSGSIWQVYTPPPTPTERPQLWWVKEFSEHWRLVPHTATENSIRQVYTHYRPSGIYAPED
jgi:hypothetical protein